MVGAVEVGAVTGAGATPHLVTGATEVTAATGVTTAIPASAAGPASDRREGLAAMSLAPRVVLVHRETELQELAERHSTPQQAAFFLAQRGRSLDSVRVGSVIHQSALDVVAAAIPQDWRRGDVERSDLARFVFGPEDIVVAVGQDGLVANVAKYLDGQPVIGIDPDPARNPGVLVRHPPEAVADLLSDAGRGRAATEARSMVQATTDDGQSLVALNEIYLGHPTHQSARYSVEAPDGRLERQSSSGILAGTGTGSTGWCRSAWLERRSPLTLPAPTDRALCWFVREAWPSPSTGTDLTEGTVAATEQLLVTAESDLVMFGDGIETDFVPVTWGQSAALRVADRRLNLVV